MTVHRAALFYGSTRVPYTVSWSGEAETFVDFCHVAGVLAVCQKQSPGQGRPDFGKPHWNRQRETIAHDLCDICGKPLKNRTKVSLSHAAQRFNAAQGAAILQVEPLLHRECAVIALEHCPSLKKDIAAGTLFVRQVLRHRCQYAIIGPEFVGEYVPGYEANPRARIIGHAKVELMRWKERDAEWLTRTRIRNSPPSQMQRRTSRKHSRF